MLGAVSKLITKVGGKGSGFVLLCEKCFHSYDSGMQKYGWVMSFLGQGRNKNWNFAPRID